MNVILALLWVLLVSKLAWNLSLPFRLARRSVEGDTGDASLMAVVEFVLMPAMTVIAFLSAGGHWWNQWHYTIAAASGATLASYIVLFLVVRARTR